MPVLDEGSLAFPGYSLSFVRLDVQPSMPAYIGQMRRDGAGPVSTAGHFHHHLGCPPHRAPDLLDLGAREAAGHPRPRAGSAEDVKEWPAPDRETDNVLSHCDSPS